MADKKKKNKGFGVACCFLVALVIFIIFLVQRKTIVENLKDTHLFERLGIKTPKIIENYEIPKDAQSEDELTLKEETFTIHVEQPENIKDENSGKNVQESKSDSVANKTATQETSQTSNNGAQTGKTTAESASNSTNASKTSSKTSDAAKTESSGKTTTSTAEVKYTDLQLCFVDYGADGIVYRKIVKRSVPKNDSPLTNAIKLLLEGPDSSKSAEKDCLTLIPENTRLLSAKVENGIAYLNFSEDFEFNSFGVDGYRSQLMQVVYTATAFSTVKSVQFLIDGQKKEYLGSEGQRIGSPLSRNSF